MAVPTSTMDSYRTLKSKERAMQHLRFASLEAAWSVLVMIGH
jgi:hypothetical protein